MSHNRSLTKRNYKIHNVGGDVETLFKYNRLSNTVQEYNQNVISKKKDNKDFPLREVPRRINRLNVHLINRAINGILDDITKMNIDREPVVYDPPMKYGRFNGGFSTASVFVIGSWKYNVINGWYNGYRGLWVQLRDDLRNESITKLPPDIPFNYITDSTGATRIVTSTHSMFYNCTNLSDISSLANWNVSTITEMSYMFNSCKGLINDELKEGEYDLKPLENWDVSNVTKMNSMFIACTNLQTLKGLEKWNTKSLSVMNDMFHHCYALYDIEALANWDVSKVGSFYRLFCRCESLTSAEPLAKWNTGNVTNMADVFNGCITLKDIGSKEENGDKTGLYNWDVSKVNTTYYMFHRCFVLKDISALEDWKTDSLTSTHYMFALTALNSLKPLAKWNMSNATHINSMFESVKTIATLAGLENWDVSKVETLGFTFAYMDELRDISALTYWQTDSLNYMRGMLHSCYSLTSLMPLMNFNTSRVTNMVSVFRNGGDTMHYENLIPNLIPNLNALYRWDTGNATDMTVMFESRNMDVRDVAALSNWNFDKVRTMASIFNACDDLPSEYKTTNYTALKATLKANKLPDTIKQGLDIYYDIVYNQPSNENEATYPIKDAFDKYYDDVYNDSNTPEDIKVALEEFRVAAYNGIDKPPDEMSNDDKYTIEINLKDNFDKYYETVYKYYNNPTETNPSNP